ncbi:hypothetical protein FBQ85_28095 [Cytophagia bacterium CHB2]|nr:hypothetical protein [Cytophagia bacterium CHB2]
MVVGNLSGTDATQVEIDLAGSIGANTGDGQVDSVTANGTTTGDVISVTETGGQILVNGLPAQVRIAHAEVNDRLILNGQSGDDVIDASTLASGMPGLDFNGGLGGDILIGSQNGDRFLGGDGNDIAIMGPGDDSFVWNPGDDNDVIEGDTGFDTLLFNGSNVSENISISANGGRTSFFRDVANVTMDLNDTEAIEFIALGGADTITVNNLAGTDITEVDINLGASGGGGDGQADVINVMATAADDVILVTMAGSDIIILGLSATVVVRNFEAANDRLHVSGLGGDDVIDASGAAVPVFLDGGDDDDILLGGSKHMVVYDDMEPSEKVKVFNRGVEITEKESVYQTLVQYRMGDMYAPKIDQTEALSRLVAEFVDCIRTGRKPLTDGKAGYNVVRILEAADKSLRAGGRAVQLSAHSRKEFSWKTINEFQQMSNSAKMSEYSRL